MKKSMLIFCLVLAGLSVTGFGLINQYEQEVNSKEVVHVEKTPENDATSSMRNFDLVPDFFFDVGSRFMMTVTKEELNQAGSIVDFLPQRFTESIDDYAQVIIVLWENEDYSEKKEVGKNDVLTAPQRDMLRSADYSTSFMVRADYKQTNSFGNERIESTTPHITIVPEKEALYSDGKESLLDFLQLKSLAQTSLINKDNLRPGKLFFTVNPTGSISSAHIKSTSGYDAIDKKMLDLIKQLPGKWVPAENGEGEKVAQEFVLSFGVIGC